jgi:hypothetical protein
LRLTYNRASELRDLLSRLQHYVADLTSHVIPFVVVKEEATHAGPIYELHTGRDNKARCAKKAPPIVSHDSHKIPTEVLLRVDTVGAPAQHEEERLQL